MYYINVYLEYIYICIIINIHLYNICTFKNLSNRTVLNRSKLHLTLKFMFYFIKELSYLTSSFYIIYEFLSVIVTLTLQNNYNPNTMMKIKLK